MLVLCELCVDCRALLVAVNRDLVVVRMIYVTVMIMADE